MTLSVLAMDKKTGAIGCAAATGNIAVGGWVLHAAADGGAVATQGMSVSTIWGDKALQLLRQGKSLTHIFDTIVLPDTGREYRQIALLDLEGNTKVFTGMENITEMGFEESEAAVFTGNWLANENILPAMKQAYEKNIEAEFGCRLLGTLRAGLAAGSDARGTLSAAMKIVHPSCAPLDLRVDYDEEPIQKLTAIYKLVTASPYADWLDKLPTIEEPNRC